MNRNFAKLKKIKSHNISERYQDGHLFIGWFYTRPNIGSRFYFTINNDSDGSLVSTSTVVEIIDQNTFRTENSTYHLITIEEEREEKINTIIS